ncbi:fructan beta-fructosidase [Lewinella marina]|uniref:Glycosyl hydrolase family 32 n=1 Tax=Neolewinella marina TaxID=438751 RepID=A0A2G0CC41_9BACT|nr:glycoside hydrolase family 32 protein [Neolewinella marina]NJB86729.1 fructan beta-fructosidase [Neolewinella marina]PHK97536.1 glycosyl hydrolase family 32 [Neolewinella marina]
MELPLLRFASCFALITLLACGPTAPEEVVDAGSSEVSEATYQEPHRPQIHFSPPANWMNDPNGMVYHDGEYHLFYQYYPDSTVWGPMHWGHAVSTDLVHWEHLPVALYPDSLGYIFSGSAVVDNDNTSGLGQNGEAPLVAIYTYHDPEGERAGRDDYQYQGIAYSNDRGRNWTKYEGNPVLPNNTGIRDFRDPKVSWNTAAGQWVMALAAKDRISFYGSDNLIDWEHLSDFGTDQGSHAGVWECPDLFPLPVTGANGESKYVLIVSINPGAPNGGSGTQYFVGEFDGTTFTVDPSFAEDVTDEQGVWLDYGRDNYAGVTWSGIPEEDGRRLFIGWMSNWAYANVVPTERWRSALTVPRQLTLHQTPAGYRVFSQPVRELEQLRTDEFTIPEGEESANRGLSDRFSVPANAPKELELRYALSPDSKARFGVELANGKGEVYRIGYNAASGHYFSDRNSAGPATFSEDFVGDLELAPRVMDGAEVSLHLLIDRASAELFADGGATALTEIFFPTEDFNQIRLFTEGDGVRLLEGKGYTLTSIWPQLDR